MSFLNKLKEFNETGENIEVIFPDEPPKILPPGVPCDIKLSKGQRRRQISK